jgi:superfamily II RNA helicase
VVVAEILWNRVYGDRATRPADVVIMDEGHYFNDPERGYVWEQSIIGLDPRSQLVILSATIGDPEQFCAWVYSVRRVEMGLVAGTERKVPLYHEYRENYLIEVVRSLHENGETPAIVFGFGREQCFERARLLKSCPRFTSDEERQRIAELVDSVLLPGGGAKELKPLLLHGIGIHHAGILPRYKQMVEKLALERLVKFVVSTETISAGINLPAKRVIFPELRKVIKGKPRLVTSAEYHQMSGRAGRPQFDKEGIAITLAPRRWCRRSARS